MLMDLLRKTNLFQDFKGAVPGHSSTFYLKVFYLFPSVPVISISFKTIFHSKRNDFL